MPEEDRYPGGLSPTGRTIKIDAAKLRASSLPIVGENPVGPELSADLTEEEAERLAYSNLARLEVVTKQRKELAEEARLLMGPNASRRGHVPTPPRPRYTSGGASPRL